MEFLEFVELEVVGELDDVEVVIEFDEDEVDDGDVDDVLDGEELDEDTEVETVFVELDKLEVEVVTLD